MRYDPTSAPSTDWVARTGVNLGHGLWGTVDTERSAVSYTPAGRSAPDDPRFGEPVKIILVETENLSQHGPRVRTNRRGRA